RSRLADGDLVAAAELEDGQEGHRPLGTREAVELCVEVEARALADQCAEALEERRDRRKAELHVRERDGRRLRGEQADDVRERLRILLCELALRLWRHRRRAEAAETGALPG